MVVLLMLDKVVARSRYCSDLDKAACRDALSGSRDTTLGNGGEGKRKERKREGEG